MSDNTPTKEISTNWKCISDLAERISSGLFYCGYAISAVGLICMFFWEPFNDELFFLVVAVGYCFLASFGSFVLAGLMICVSDFADNRSAQLRARAAT